MKQSTILLAGQIQGVIPAKAAGQKVSPSSRLPSRNTRNPVADTKQPGFLLAQE